MNTYKFGITFILNKFKIITILMNNNDIEKLCESQQSTISKLTIQIKKLEKEIDVLQDKASVNSKVKIK